MQQIFVIHGGGAFATYERYFEDLQNFKVDIDRLHPKQDWKANLPEQLGKEYDVLLPSMPNKNNSQYIEWKIWFEKFIPFLQEDTIFIGHSLGAIFLAKYLSENSFPKKIKATLLVAPPFTTTEENNLIKFALPKSLDKLSQQGGQIFLYHSKDDPVVAFSELAKYQHALPNATAVVFQDRGHFNQEQFPELVAQIKQLSGL